MTPLGIRVIIDEERKRFARTVIHETAGRVPIVSGVSGGSTQAGVGFTEDAADAGADAFMALPSYIVKDTMCISLGFSSKDEIRLINVSIPTREFSIEKASKVSPTSLVIKT